MPPLRAILVGEARGINEAKYAHGFVGKSGVELARMLGQSGMAPAPTARYPNEREMIAYWQHLRGEHGIAITNVFEEHPPQDDISLFFSREGNRDFGPFRQSARVGYVLPELASHVLRLWELIRTERPHVVVALGNTACWALLGQTKITALRGTTNWSERLDAKVLPTYHPAAILRQWSMRPTTVLDLKKAHAESAFPEIRRTPRWITIPEPSAVGIRELICWFNRPATSYANDIETAFGQISMTSFARSASESCVIPFMSPALIDLNDWVWQHKPHQRPPEALIERVRLEGTDFWPTPALEAAAWQIAIRALQKPIPKTGQNFLYDLGYYARQGIYPHIGSGDDTMLRHHATFPEQPKSLGYLGSLYADEAPWKLAGRASLKRDE